MRTLSLTMRMAANAELAGETIVALVTISHPSLGTPLRFSSDPTVLASADPVQFKTVSRGHDFLFLPLSVALPEEADSAEPAIQLVLDNISREAIPLIRSIATPPQVTVDLVLASDPDTVEVTWPDFDMVSATYDASKVTLGLKVNALTAEPFPSGTFSPAQFGGLF